MPPQTVAENNFTGGLVTQATGMNFPENSCTFAQNLIFRPWGLVERRLGFDAESSFLTQFLNLADSVFTQYVWKDATGNGNINITVVQVGATLSFYNMNHNAISQGLISSINLTSFSAGQPGGIALTQCQFTTGIGYLLVFNSFCSPFFVSYNALTNTITGNSIAVQYRDTYGIDEKFIDGTTDDLRTSLPITPNHNYNLFNQGWDSTVLADFQSAVGVGVNPSNNDIQWTFNFDQTARKFDPTTINTLIPSGGRAPRGHFILNVQTEDRITASGLGVTYPANYPQPVGTGTRLFATGTFWSGRAWYAGIPVQGFNNKIYFSQVADSFDTFGKCYQVNDPTSQDFFNILPTDGGVIVIQEIGTIHKLFPYQNALFVFSNTGVWMITGSSGIGLGFTATDYTVHKISTVPSISANSFVDVFGLPMWWNLTGIYTLVPGQNSFTVQSISDEKILNFFTSMPTFSKINARGAFDPIYGIVQWVFRNTGDTPIATSQQFNTVLNYNIFSKAFYTWTIPQTSDTFPITYICGILYDEMLSTLDIPRFKYLVVNNFGGANGFFTFGESKSLNYLDWEAFGLNIDYTSVMNTGYKLRGQGDKRFQQLYLTVYFQNQNLTGSQEPQTVESRCYIKAIWDYATALITNRISTPQEVVLINNSFGYGAKRGKIRGRGRAVQLAFQSLTGQPMNLIGWAMTESILPRT